MPAKNAEQFIISKFKETLDMLSTAPDGQICKTITPKFKDVKCASDMKDILDECCYASLASDFAMVCMDELWNRMLEDEHDEIVVQHIVNRFN
jgi:hypothetical protein